MYVRMYVVILYMYVLHKFFSMYVCYSSKATCYTHMGMTGWQTVAESVQMGMGAHKCSHP